MTEGNGSQHKDKCK